MSMTPTRTVHYFPSFNNLKLSHRHCPLSCVTQVPSAVESQTSYYFLYFKFDGQKSVVRTQNLKMTGQFFASDNFFLSFPVASERVFPFLEDLSQIELGFVFFLLANQLMVE